MLINHILLKIVFDRPFFVVGIDGPTASGKTYLADNLALELNKQNIPNFIFRLDWTLIDRHLRENEAEIFVSTDSPFEYEADYHMDLSRAEKFLKNIVYGFKENEKLKLSGLYSRENGGVCTGEAEVLMQNKMVIIVEGHYSHHHSLQKYIDYNLVLLSEPRELLRRKTMRAASYRDEKTVKDYFDHIDMPSYSHFLIQNHRYVTEIFDNTDFENPVKCNLNALHTFIETDYNYCRTQLPDLVEDFFSASSLRNQADFAEVKNAVNLLLKFDYEASLLFGLSENVRERSFTETLQNILKEQNVKLQFCDFKSLYSGVIQYFTVLSISGIRVLFFASSHKIRIVLLSGVSKKIYETERVFSQFSSGFSYAGTIFKKVSLLPEQGINLIVPDRFYVSEDKIHNYRKIIPSLSNNPVLFFENFINSEFELLHRFDSPDEIRCWFDIFSTAGFSPVFRDNYLYVDGRGTDEFPFVSGYPFFEKLPDTLPALTDADITLISDSGLKYVDEVIAGDIADEAAFLKLFRESREAVKSLIWEWLIRHFSDCEIFEGLTLRRLHSNFPSQFSDYYFALSLHKNTSVPFFTVYDLRKKSLDVNSYFRLSSKYKTAVGIQASQNALDAESGYLRINPAEGFSERITNILVDFLKNNPGKNIPLWSLGIDHASAKMNKKDGWTGSFLKQAFSQGFVTSVCLDVETLISSREPDYHEIENLIAEWLDVIPVCTDVELATGEKMNLLTPEKLRDLSVILRNALIKSGKDKTVFLLGPALGTAHHAESSNTSPETSRKVSEATKSAGSSGNVLHGTSFTKPEEVAEFVKNNCVRVNFAGQYLAQFIGSLPEETALRFGKNQFEWKTSFAFNNELLEKLEKSEAEKVYKAIEVLFLKHHNVLNNIELSKESAEHFRKPVTDIPDSLLKIISAKCFNP